MVRTTRKETSWVLFSLRLLFNSVLLGKGASYTGSGGKQGLFLVYFYQRKWSFLLIVAYTCCRHHLKSTILFLWHFWAMTWSSGIYDEVDLHSIASKFNTGKGILASLLFEKHQFIYASYGMEIAWNMVAENDFYNEPKVTTVVRQFALVQTTHSEKESHRKKQDTRKT